MPLLLKQMFLATSFAALWSLATYAAAQQQPESALSGDESSDFQVETLLSNLDNPTGLAVRLNRLKTGPYELLLAESGAGRVLQLTTDKPEGFREVIVGFPTNPFNNQLPYRVGPLGLEFLPARSKLIVGDSGQPDGRDLVSVYTLPADGKTLDATNRDHSVGPLRNNADADPGNVNFLAMTKAAGMVFLSAGKEEDQGVILKAGIEANRLAYLQPFPGKRNTSGRAPGGIALIPPPRPSFLVVAEIGSLDSPGDSMLTFYVPSTGKAAMSLPTGLHDIVSLAYSPSGQLYAADFAWADEGAGGVYRLDDVRVEGKQGCRAVRIASVTRPLGMAFTRDGALYVTAFGSGKNEKQGLLLKITGNL
ncbi:MAG: hypothetical protein MI725_03885 [Pirellulales bacterium]|nr:hypothetical protein [Pirellulales bacterium]